jgi:hypothetical protein
MPADSDPLALCPAGNACTDRVDDSGDFMSRNPRVLNARPRSLLGHGIAVADATSLDFYPHLSSAGLWDIAFNELKGATSVSYLHDSHHWHNVSPFDMRGGKLVAPKVLVTA